MFEGRLTIKPCTSLVYCSYVVSRPKRLSSKQSEGGQWAGYYTGPQSIIIEVFFFVDLTILGTVVNFDWLVHLVDCLNVLTNNCNLLMV